MTTGADRQGCSPQNHFHCSFGSVRYGATPLPNDQSERVFSTSDGGATFGGSGWTGLPGPVLDSAVLQFVDPVHGWSVASGGPACSFSCTARFFELFKTAGWPWPQHRVHSPESRFQGP